MPLLKNYLRNLLYYYYPTDLTEADFINGNYDLTEEFKRLNDLLNSPLSTKAYREGLNEFMDKFSMPYEKMWVDEVLEISSKVSVSVKIKLGEEVIQRGGVRMSWLIVSLSVLAPVFDIWIGKEDYLEGGRLGMVEGLEEPDYYKYSKELLIEMGLMEFPQTLKEEVLPDFVTPFIKKGEFTAYNGYFFNSINRVLY